MTRIACIEYRLGTTKAEKSRGHAVVDRRRGAQEFFDTEQFDRHGTSTSWAARRHDKQG